MMKFSITTLGCKANQYDGSALASFLTRWGWTPAGAADPVDLIAVNTCCVTAEAMRKSRQAIRRAVRGAPSAGVLVVGCYSDYDARRIRELLQSLGVAPARTAVAGHHQDLARHVRALLRVLSAGVPPREQSICPGSDEAAGGDGDDGLMSAEGQAVATVAGGDTHTVIRAMRKGAVKRNSPGTRDFGPIARFEGHQRAFVKVQDGCDAFCSYCIVPYTRVNLWSRSVEEILDECRQLVAGGHRELVLSGVFLGAFGRATAIRRRWGPEPAPLGRLVREVAAIDGLWRVRLSSLEPGDVTDDLLAVYASTPAVAPHFHLPLQSGSEEILRRMNRQYTAGQFARTVDRVRATLDRASLTTDVIVGFPGETDEDFAATLDLARRAAFAKIHAFRFSAVEGTAAWLRRAEAPGPDVVRRRLADLREVESQTALAYRSQFVGETMEALVESPRPGTPLRQAMTDRYVTVFFQPPAAADGDALTGQVVGLRILEPVEEGLRGEWAE